jgi:hypothetical protein
MVHPPSHAARIAVSFEIIDPSGAVVRSACRDKQLAIRVAEWADVALTLEAADSGAVPADPDSARDRRERAVPPPATDATLSSHLDDVHLEV